MSTKNIEEVRKRRGKTSSRSRFGFYQKAVIVGGILTLFLTFAFRPRMSPFLSAGILGGTLLFFLLFRKLKSQKEESNKSDPLERLLQLEDMPVEQPESIIAPGDKEVLSLRETVATEIIELPQGPPDKDEAEGKLEEEVHEEEEIMKDPQVLHENGRWVELQEKIVLLEEKTINLEDMLMQLQEKVADIRANDQKAEPKIDLQTILTNIEERAERIA